MKNQEKFSIKKLLLTILCSVILSVFIGTTSLFIESCSTKIQIEALMGLDKNSQILIDFGKTYQAGTETLKKEVQTEKLNYGEDYPSEGIILYLVMNKFSTDHIIDVYLLALVIGVVTGIVIYIIAIQKVHIKHALIELFISFIILYLILTLINFGYGFLIKNIINSSGSASPEYLNLTYVYDLYNLDIENIIFIYLIIGLIVFIINKIRQEILANKLNKELHK